MVNFVRLLTLVCFLLAPNSVSAEDLTYTEIEAGDTAPFTGMLYTHAAIAKILADQALEIEKLNIDFQYQLKISNSDWQLKYNILQKKSSKSILKFS